MHEYTIVFEFDSLRCGVHEPSMSVCTTNPSRILSGWGFPKITSTSLGSRYSWKLQRKETGLDARACHGTFATKDTRKDPNDILRITKGVWWSYQQLERSNFGLRFKLKPNSQNGRSQENLIQGKEAYQRRSGSLGATILFLVVEGDHNLAGLGLFTVQVLGGVDIRFQGRMRSRYYYSRIHRDNMVGCQSYRPFVCVSTRMRSLAIVWGTQNGTTILTSYH